MMMSEALERLATAAAVIARLEPRLDQARRDRLEAVREAHAQGTSLALIAKVAGISRQRVDQMLRQSRKAP